MPSINDFVSKKNSKKGPEWSLPTISKQTTTPQRRPGRGEDDPLQVVQTSASPTTLADELKPTTNPQQSYNKVTTINGGVNSTIRETYNKLPTELTTQSTTKLQQTYSKVTTESSFLALVGLQRRLIIFLYELCRSQGVRVTNAVSIANIAISCKTTSRAAQETIRRLEFKGFIRRTGYKNGRGGWTTYELPEGVYRELFQLETSNKLTTNLQQTPNKLPTELTTQPTTSLSSSSSFIELENLKTTTTGEPELFDDARIQLSPEWSEVDFSPLSEIGFSRAHILQLAKHAKLSAEEVQNSIHFFAFDLKRNDKGREVKGPPVNFFMGILRKGLPYAPPENYESPEAEARRKYIEGKRRLEEQRLAEEQELRDLEYAEWRRGLSHQQITAIVPEVVLRIPRACEETLKSHFQDNVWPSRCATIPGTTDNELTEIRQQIDQSLGDAQV